MSIDNYTYTSVSYGFRFGKIDPVVFEIMDRGGLGHVGMGWIQLTI